jgi:hypothetical protein
MTADHHPIDSREAGQISWQIRAEMALESTIQTQQCLTYAALAEAARIPAPHRIHKLTGWLEAVITRDHHAGKPLRAAAVISRRRNGLPAPGFFDRCRDLGLYDGPSRGEAAAAFHQQLLGELFSR